MVIDNKHTISRAGGVRADNDHDCYDYYKNNCRGDDLGGAP
jgi:hypothetical protein